jgi:hypothetical protein
MEHVSRQRRKASIGFRRDEQESWNGSVSNLATRSILSKRFAPADAGSFAHVRAEHVARPRTGFGDGQSRCEQAFCADAHAT